jgi:hypothetical protein
MSRRRLELPIRLVMPEQPPFNPELLPPDLQGQTEPDYERLVDAIFPSEGGADKTKHVYGIKSVKVKDRQEARRVALNTVRNNFKRWQDAGGKWKDGQPVTYFEYLARTFVPPSVDPVGHKNWLINVPAFYDKYGKQRQEDLQLSPEQNQQLAAFPTPTRQAYNPALRDYSVR